MNEWKKNETREELRKSCVDHTRLCFLYNVESHTPLVRGTTLGPHAVLPHKEFTPSFASPVSCNKSLLDCGWSLCIGKMEDGAEKGTMKAVAFNLTWSKQSM